MEQPPNHIRSEFAGASSRCGATGLCAGVTLPPSDARDDAETILAIVAEKFGLPVRCAPAEPFSTLYTGRYHVRPDNSVVVDVMTTGNAGKVQMLGMFNPTTNWCDRVWAFNIEGYGAGWRQ